MEKKKRRKRKTKKQKQREKVRNIILILVLITAAIGVSFALFTTTLTGTKINKITTSNFEFAIENETPEDGVFLENEYPATDDEGLKKAAYEFDLVSYSNVDADYDFYLKVPFTSDLQLSNIKYNLKRNEKDVSKEVPLLSSTVEKNTQMLESEESTTIGSNGKVGDIKKVSYGSVMKDTLIYNYSDNQMTPTEESLLEGSNIYYDGYIDFNGKRYIIALGKGEHDVSALNMYYILEEDVSLLYTTDMIYDEMENEYFLLYKLDTALISPLATNHYKLNIWIDYDAGNEAINKSFEAKALINVVQHTR